VLILCHVRCVSEGVVVEEIEGVVEGFFQERIYHRTFALHKGQFCECPCNQGTMHPV